MIHITATAASVQQAEALLTAGVDTLYIGEENFGLRLPVSFLWEEIAEITRLAHEEGREVCAAVNALMDNERIEAVVLYLKFLYKTGVDKITVGDPGIIHLLDKYKLPLRYFYDAQTMMTSARQVNFWAKRGAEGAVLARKIPFAELQEIQEKTVIPVEVLVYGATCIHHSKRPLLDNYEKFTGRQLPKEEGLYLSEPENPDSHYSIYQDSHGTHVFAANDVNLFPHLKTLTESGITHWKLDGLFTNEADFVAAARLFVQAAQALAAGKWTVKYGNLLNSRLRVLHSEERSLDAAFFIKQSDEVR